MKKELRYWWRRLLRYLFICLDCGCRMNATSKGRALCPECGR
jgi:DNA-directed RNA polymerase subunit RPC12/RpoP